MFNYEIQFNPGYYQMILHNSTVKYASMSKSSNMEPFDLVFSYS